MAGSNSPSFGPGDRVLIAGDDFADFDGTVDGFKGELVLSP